jgi:phospholipase C
MSQPDQSRQVSAGAVSSRLRGSARRLFVTYDEHDGFFDHQLPPFPEATVTDEFIGGLPIGPGWAG